MYKINELPFIVNSVGKFYCWPTWKWSYKGPLKWPDFDLWTIAAGKGTLHAHGKTYDLKTGDCFLMRGGEIYHCEQDPENNITTFYVHLNFVKPNGKILERSSPKAPPFYRRLPDFGFYSDLFDRLVSEYEKKNDENIRTILSTILYEVNRVDQLPKLSGYEKDQFENINDMCIKISKNPTDNFTIAALAKECHYTPSHFCRVFKKYKKIPPQDFIINNRIRHAKSMLLNSSNTIYQIADMLGYKNVYFFSRQFKKVAGCSPLEFRKNIFK